MTASGDQGPKRRVEFVAILLGCGWSIQEIVARFNASEDQGDAGHMQAEVFPRLRWPRLDDQADLAPAHLVTAGCRRVRWRQFFIEFLGFLALIAAMVLGLWVYYKVKTGN